MIGCADQQEIDAAWDTIAQGRQEIQCGWLKDRYGVTWQIVPNRMEALLNDADPHKAGRVWQALLAMKKIDIASLERARDA